MIKVGITGGIGSGKTYVCTYFSRLGIPIYDSDVRAKELMNTSGLIRKKITELFGSQSFIDGDLNRSFLSKIVFADTKKLQQLNEIVHPEVKKNFEIWTKQNRKSPYVLKESAVLIENNIHKELDFIILVTAPIKIRIQRVMSRNFFTKKQVKERINNQLSDEEKEKYADYIILNDGNQNIDNQINKIHKELLNKSK